MKKQPIKPNPNKRLTIDRQINDTDIWVVEIKGYKRFIGGFSELNRQFEKQNNDWKCTVKIRFIDKSGQNVEKY